MHPNHRASSSSLWLITRDAVQLNLTPSCKDGTKECSSPPPQAAGPRASSCPLNLCMFVL